jgi:hypothetical protein
MKQQNPLPRIAQSILSAARARGTAIQDWYLSDAEYEEYMRASECLCGLPTMKICGASIHRATAPLVPQQQPHASAQPPAASKHDHLG